MAETEAAETRRGQVLRFVLLGVGNTLVTGTLLAFLARMLDPDVAYTIVFATGLIGTTVLSGRFVFQTEVTFTRSIAFVSVYLVIYAWGRIAIAVVRSFLGHNPDVMATAVVIATAPLSFLGGRLVFGRQARGNTGPSKSRGDNGSPAEETRCRGRHIISRTKLDNLPPDDERRNFF